MGLLTRIHRLFRHESTESTAHLWASASKSPFGVNPHLPVERCTVDNRVFLLGLDQLYREAMQSHEKVELLACARAVAAALDIRPADVPVEGYYADDPNLAEYFCLMRTLQDTNQNRSTELDAVPEFLRLFEVASARLYGVPVKNGKLLPLGRDPLSEALRATWPDWNVTRLTDSACAAVPAEDISLVGLAARIKDPVVLAALRESVVLYGESMFGALPPPREFLWQVDDELARHATRFVNTFNALFGDELPLPIIANAELYWSAYSSDSILGRCVRLGQTDTLLNT